MIAERFLHSSKHLNARRKRPAMPREETSLFEVPQRLYENGMVVPGRERGLPVRCSRRNMSKHELLYPKLKVADESNSMFYVKQRHCDFEQLKKFIFANIDASVYDIIISKGICINFILF